MAKSKSSKQWLNEHFADPYVQRAQAMGYRSRAVFKLLEIHEKNNLIRSGMTVLDLGAAPGGWSQVCAQLVGSKGLVIASDILPMDPIPGVNFIQGDFQEPAVLDQLLQALGERRVDLVISDMAPNMSGKRSIDQPRAMILAELALDCAEKVLTPGGCLLVKIFQGVGFAAYLQRLRANFDRVVTRKPQASRARSQELYLLAKGYNIS